LIAGIKNEKSLPHIDEVGAGAGEVCMAARELQPRGEIPRYGTVTVGGVANGVGGQG
jgi:hypothetical protein